MWHIVPPPGPPVVTARQHSVPVERVSHSPVNNKLITNHSDPRSRGTMAPVSSHPNPRDSKHRDKELEEARLRTVQLEKTMRWWSDCTASWREKWALVRDERNQLRDELRQTRKSLEVASRKIKQLEQQQQQQSNQSSSTTVLLPEKDQSKTRGSSCIEQHHFSESSPLESITGSLDQKIETTQPIPTTNDDLSRSPGLKTQCPRKQCAFLVRWWKEQAEFLSRELHRMLVLNTEQWAQCQRLSHENRRLKLVRSYAELPIDAPSCRLLTGTRIHPAHSSSSMEEVAIRRRSAGDPISLDPSTVEVRHHPIPRPYNASPDEHNAQLLHLQNRIRTLVEERNQLYERLEEAINQRMQLEAQCDRMFKCCTLTDVTASKDQPGYPGGDNGSLNFADCTSTLSAMVLEGVDSEPSDLLIEFGTNSVAACTDSDTLADCNLLHFTQDSTAMGPTNDETEGDGTLRMTVSTLNRASINALNVWSMEDPVSLSHL